MSEFFSGNIPSAFPNQNILFNSASGLTGQELQKNQLAIQGQQMDLTNGGPRRRSGQSCGWAALELIQTTRRAQRRMRRGSGCSSRRAWPSTPLRRCRTSSRCACWSARLTRPRHRPSGCRTSRPTRNIPMRATPPPRQRLGPPQGPQRQRLAGQHRSLEQTCPRG